MATEWVIGLFCFTTVIWFWIVLAVFVWRYRLRSVTSLIQDEQSENRNDVERSCLPPSYADVEKHPSIYIININTVVQEEISPPNYDTAMTSNLPTENNESQSNTLALMVPTERY